MKMLIVGFLLLILVSDIQARITKRVIHAGDTPLFSDCTVTQTGPMQLTVKPCTFVTTGRAKIFDVIRALPAQIGVGELAKALREDKAEWMPDGLRVRGWIQDEKGKIIDKSTSYHLLTKGVINITTPGVYVILLMKSSGFNMDVVLASSYSPSMVNYVHILALEFDVPLGTINLSDVDIILYTVKPGHRPKKGIFEQ